MSRISGYSIVIKAFIPSPKDDFDKQAAAATAMGVMTKTKKLPDNFAEIATITEIKGKFGSLAEDETPQEPEAPADPETPNKRNKPE